jgi:hypothetical protein
LSISLTVLISVSKTYKGGLKHLWYLPFSVPAVQAITCSYVGGALCT